MTFGKKIRCGICRRKSEFTCYTCGTEIFNPRSTLCDKCKIISNRMKQKRFYDTHTVYEEKECVICNKLLPRGFRKTCPGKCLDKYKKQYFKNRVGVIKEKRFEQRRHKECVICFKSMKDLDRKMTCSPECSRHYHNLYQQYYIRNVLKN